MREKLGSTPVLVLVLSLCVARLWLTPLPSSFWVDEMVTAFVIHFGPAHPSLAVAPQVTETIYYWLPRTAERLFGFSEVVYRAPSAIVLGIALWLIARLAGRLIHPQAAWFAVFACLALKGFNYQAADARPYALGTCVAAASLFELVRWLDTARRRDALLFLVFAALLWRVHLVFWPFYAIFPLYLAVRILRAETSVTRRQAAAVFALLVLTLIPVAIDAIRLVREAHAHVIADLPGLRDLRRTLKFLLIAQCGGGALLAALLLRRTPVAIGNSSPVRQVRDLPSGSAPHSALREFPGSAQGAAGSPGGIENPSAPHSVLREFPGSAQGAAGSPGGIENPSAPHSVLRKFPGSAQGAAGSPGGIENPSASRSVLREFPGSAQGAAGSPGRIENPSAPRSVLREFPGSAQGAAGSPGGIESPSAPRSVLREFPGSAQGAARTPGGIQNPSAPHSVLRGFPGRDAAMPPLSAWVLILGWWLWHPLALFAFSHITGNSVYVDRYLSLALPGAALTATLAAAWFLDPRDCRMCAALLGVCVLIALGQWRQLWPAHHNSDWRDAARAVTEWTVDADTPVLLPSPFIEAKPPVWRPDYPLPGFLYCYLPVYKISGKPYLLPFERSPQGERYASSLLPVLSASPRFLIYGGDKNVFVWRSFLASRPELAGWGNRQFHSFGDVDVAIFENPAFSRALALR